MKFKDLFSFTQKEITNAFEKAKPINQINGLKLLNVSINKKDFGKLLIVTSRKTGKAHKRNKIKRQIKEIFYQEKLFQKPTTHILLVYSQALQLTYEKLKEFLVKNIKTND